MVNGGGRARGLPENGEEARRGVTALEAGRYRKGKENAGQTDEPKKDVETLTMRWATQ